MYSSIKANANVDAEVGNVNAEDKVNAHVEFNVEDGAVNALDNLIAKDDVNVDVDVNAVDSGIDA